MSERTFFNFRYTIPGSLFILGLLTTNPEIFEWILSQPEQTPILSILLGLFTIFGGSVIGLLISQFWYFLFQHAFKINEKLEYRKQTLDFIKSKYKIPRSAYENHQKMIVIYDFLLNYDSNREKENKNFRDYILRRWDLTNTIGSSLTSSFIGIIIGICFRFYIFKPQLVIENSYWALIIIFYIITFIISLFVMEWIKNELNLMSIALINKINLKTNELIIVFPEIQNNEKLV